MAQQGGGQEAPLHVHHNAPEVIPRNDASLARMRSRKTRALLAAGLVFTFGASVTAAS